MTKRYFSLFFAVLGTLFQCFAQNHFSVKVPPFHRYVKITTSNVNLRQQPDAQSARLIWHGEYDELGIGGESLRWKSGSLGRGEKPAHAKVLPVWESSFMPVVKNVDGWLCGHYQGKLVYVMEKFCKDVALRPLSLPAPIECFDAVKIIETGQYKGYCIGWRSEGMDEPARLYIGKYVNGMFIFNFSIECHNWSEKTIPVIEDHKYYFGSNLCGEIEISLDKLMNNSKALDLLMSISKDIKNHYKPLIYFGVEGDNYWYEIEGIF